MDGDLLLIFGFVVALALIVFPFVILTHRRVVRHEERKLELELQIEQARKGQAAKNDQSFQQLEDRLRVLKRIATDPSADISRQIENLREIKAEGEKV
ncbi:hypothetical protein [Erythrobacter alti]|uniref:hypothetical protein n=1 Tax=Erythrobacter alti TaxID=1896145 RepID=UPI0030F3BB83